MTGVSAESERREEAGGAALLRAFEEEPVGEEEETSVAIEALDEAQGKRRILVMAGVGIPVAALVAVGVAMLIHLLVAGGFLAAWWWGTKVQHGQGAGGPGVSTGGDGFVVMDLEGKGGKTTGQEKNVDPTEAMKGSGKAAEVVKLPAALTETPAAPAVVPPVAAAPAAVAVGPTVVNPVGEVKVAAPAAEVVRAAAPAAPTAAAVAPAQLQQASSVPKNVVASATPKQVAAGAKDAGEEIVNPGGTADGGGTGEETVDIMGPGYKGLGSGGGSGSRRGGGLDRGPSGADNPEPQILLLGTVEAPASAILHPPTQDAIFEVEVLASGKAGKIVLKQSSGNKDYDDVVRLALLTSSYRPAYVAGAPVTRTMTFVNNVGPQ